MFTFSLISIYSENKSVRQAKRIHVNKLKGHCNETYELLTCELLISV
jgi:hypothetical protein